MGGVPPEVMQGRREPAPGSRKPPVPYHGSNEGEEPFNEKKNKEMIPSISLAGFEMDPAKVYGQLFGKDASQHEYTRELVQGG
jgi:hypothetical protein